MNEEKIEKKNRLTRLEEKIKGLEEDKEKDKKIKKKFRLPFSFKILSKKAQKNPEYVFVQYLSLKKDVDYKVCKVVSGDIVVINNKAHELDPDAIWRHKKTMFYIIREIDRKPVSNKDYKEVKNRGDDTEADVPLIKAVLGATNKNNNPLKNTNVIVWILLAVAVAGVIMMFGGGA